jgi:uncharacterized protein YcbX
MQIVGRVESLWRYPVKSMRGERVDEAFAGFSGIYGDRMYAFLSSAAPAAFPFFTGREQEELLLYRPKFRQNESMRRPPNLAEAEGLGSGVTSIYAAPADQGLDIETPEGQTYSIDDPALVQRLRDGLGERHDLTLRRSDRALTDCRPVSLFGVWTARQLSDEVGDSVDQRRFRANIYVDLASRKGFGEDELVAKRVRVGNKAIIEVLQRDGRCKMITLDPDTAEQNPEVMRCVKNRHEGMAGVYGAVLVEGTIRPGDEMILLD